MKIVFFRIVYINLLFKPNSIFKLLNLHHYFYLIYLFIITSKYLIYNMRLSILSFIFILVFVGCKKENQAYQKDIANPSYLHRILDRYTEIIVHDIFSPPVASRNYVYPIVASYEAARHLDPNAKSMAGQINGLTEVPKPDPSKKICFELAAIKAMTLTCKKFIFSEADLIEFEKQIFSEIEKINAPKDVYKNSVAYGELVANHIMAWADKDNYKQSRTFPKFNVDPSIKPRWKPTPPGYMDAIEPHWNSIRSMTFDSAAQFKPLPPTPFDLNKNSKFMKEVMEVYNVGKNLTDEEKNIANYWDCNPYKINVIGHAMHATKKITPGGHWMSIANQVSRLHKDDFLKTLKTYVLISFGLFDGFISCWDEKYRSNLVRPESIINDQVDPDWVPLLQTPPFPEYTSGHSVISNASGTILMKIYGDSFAFVDSTEVRFGLEARKYSSISKAAEEASISRLYGGIHYRPAIEDGASQGKNIGQHILNKIKFN